MRTPKATLVLIALACVFGWWLRAGDHAIPFASERSPAIHAPPASAAQQPAFLPPEALDTLALIRHGGPYPYRQDDGVFGNREGRLPRRPHGYYHEYTVETPGASDRGTRRIITGGQPPEAYYYTADHYRSFRRFRVPR